MCFLCEGNWTPEVTLPPLGGKTVSHSGSKRLQVSGWWPALRDPARSLQKSINPSRGSNSLRIKRALCIPEIREGRMYRDFWEKCGESMIPGCYYAAEDFFFSPLNGVLCSRVNSCTGFDPSTFCFLIFSQASLSCGAFSSLLSSFPHPLLSFYNYFNFMWLNWCRGKPPGLGRASTGVRAEGLWMASPSPSDGCTGRSVWEQLKQNAFELCPCRMIPRCVNSSLPLFSDCSPANIHLQISSAQETWKSIFYNICSLSPALSVFSDFALYFISPLK